MEAFRQELTECSYSREDEVTFADCDRNRKMRVGAMLDRMATMAGFDYDARGLTYEVLYEKREVFLLSRLSLKIHRCPVVRDVLEMNTWENGTKGAHLQRVYQLRLRSGELCVSAKSDWIMVDPVTRKILRPSGFTAKAITTCPVEIDCPEPKKIVLPHEGAESLGTRVVRWSDLDGNGHLYSGNYGDVIWDYLPADLQEKTPREFTINYSKEATLGEELTITGVREETDYRMEGMGPEAACFTALCRF